VVELLGEDEIDAERSAGVILPVMGSRAVEARLSPTARKSVERTPNRARLNFVIADATSGTRTGQIESRDYRDSGSQED
jgi:hypothetical protein